MYPLKTVALVLSVLAMAAGGLGMMLSFIYLASNSMEDITAGTSGFVAGSVLIGSGLISFAIIAAKDDQRGRSNDDEYRRASSTDISL